MQILTKGRTGSITCLSFSRSHETRHTGISFYQFHSRFLQSIWKAPLFDKIAGKIQGASSQDSYLSGVGATSGVNTDLPPEARLGQGYWDLPSGIQGKSTSLLTSSSRKSSTT
ncbi:hypothetical protein PVA48_12875 [Akkermansia sp. JRP_AM1]|uniref:hypothetical protein n=1 Tax=Akkermansia sp. JRP_AM1 TaxID=3414159 RepID=UPI003BFA748C